MGEASHISLLGNTTVYGSCALWVLQHKLTGMSGAMALDCLPIVFSPGMAALFQIHCEIVMATEQVSWQ